MTDDERMTEDERKYLEFLQAVIGRMASNSFQLKGWSVGLGSVIIGLTAKDGQPKLAWLALVPVVAFWAFDGYYLSLERAYRTVYERAVPALRERYHAQAPPQPQVEAPTVYDLRVDPPARAAWVATALSASVAVVHGSLVAIALFVVGLGYVHGFAAPAPEPHPATSAPTTSAPAASAPAATGAR